MAAPGEVAGTPVVVLAGGRGTRIASVTGDLVPKVLLPVGGRPFLEHVLGWLEDEGALTVVVAIGFLGEQVRARFGERWRRMALHYSHDGERLLGTGGALRSALALVPDRERSFVVNGDTWFPVPLAALLARHVESGAAITVALARQENRGRYGAVDVAPDGRVVAFREKAEEGPGWINGGVYCVERGVLAAFPDGAFSLERDLLVPKAREGKVFALGSDRPFCDIGAPGRTGASPCSGDEGPRELRRRVRRPQPGRRALPRVRGPGAAARREGSGGRPRGARRGPACRDRARHSFRRRHPLQRRAPRGPSARQPGRPGPSHVGGPSPRDEAPVPREQLHVPAGRGG